MCPLLARDSILPDSTANNITMHVCDSTIFNWIWFKMQNMFGWGKHCRMVFDGFPPLCHNFDFQIWLWELPFYTTFKGLPEGNNLTNFYLPHFSKRLDWRLHQRASQCLKCELGLTTDQGVSQGNWSGCATRTMIWAHVQVWRPKWQKWAFKPCSKEV